MKLRAALLNIITSGEPFRKQCFYLQDGLVVLSVHHDQPSHADVGEVKQRFDAVGSRFALSRNRTSLASSCAFACPTKYLRVFFFSLAALGRNY
jgi:hypothetical protein